MFVKFSEFAPHALFCKFAPHALKGQKLLAQGNALGILAFNKTPCKGKSFVYCLVIESFCPFRATGLDHTNPGRCPGLGASALSGRMDKSWQYLIQK